MDYFLLFGIIGFSCLILSFIAYSTTTNKIIKSQEREIEILRTDNERLRSALRGAKYVEKIVLYDNKISNPEPAKVKLTKDLFKEF